MEKNCKFGKFKVKINNYPSILHFMEYWARDNSKKSETKCYTSNNNDKPFKVKFLDVERR